VGWVTSAVENIGMGYVKRGFNSVGNRLVAIDLGRPERVEIPVEIVPFPGN